MAKQLVRELAVSTVKVAAVLARDMQTEAREVSDRMADTEKTMLDLKIQGSSAPKELQQDTMQQPTPSFAHAAIA